MRRVTVLRSRDENGAVVVLMAVFSLVMLGMAALVVDVGSILDERRQLQNGADAAALGLAQYIGQSCPVTPTCTPLSLKSAADSLANLNARDNFAKVYPPVADYTTKRVTVTTSTQDGAGATILPYSFGRSLTGAAGKTVHARASASWAGLKRASVVPLTLSKCEFTTVTHNGTVFDVATIILFHTKAASCGGGPDLPGGFGWLADDNDSNPDDCNISPSAGDKVHEDTGVVGTPHSCNLSTLLGKDVLFAIYDSVTGSGSNGVYHVYGFGEFHLTGYRFSSSNSGGVVPCASPNTCVGGYFIRFVATGDYGGPNLGNRVTLVS
jgi:hypothetical protein